jgi:hypothetical protein
LNNDSIDVGIKKLWVLEQNQPRGVEDLSSKMGEVGIRRSLAERSFNLVLDLIR